MLMLKSHRLQVLVDDEQFRRLEVAAARRKVPVAVIVREALDEKLPSLHGRRRAAAERILSAELMDVGDPEELCAELEAMRGGDR
ncbi:MAG TPA: antitoxin [Thermoanaerobaculia bacterium]|jgi:hypothetical protein|nr:antitoxin [Thermoanaerobaculia bacterium]